MEGMAIMSALQQQDTCFDYILLTLFAMVGLALNIAMLVFMLKDNHRTLPHILYVFLIIFDIEVLLFTAVMCSLIIFHRRGSLSTAIFFDISKMGSLASAFMTTVVSVVLTLAVTRPFYKIRKKLSFCLSDCILLSVHSKLFFFVKCIRTQCCLSW